MQTSIDAGPEHLGFRVEGAAGLWNRLFGKPPTLVVEVRWAQARPPVVLLPEVRVRIHPGDRSAHSAALLRQLGPVLMDDLRRMLFGHSERRAHERRLWTYPIRAAFLGEDGRPGVRVLPVGNRFFGGNIGVTGLLVGDDLARVLSSQPEGDRYLLPDVCLSQGRFLDGGRPGDLPRPVEVVATHGAALREAIRR